jgi:hypothetical protein
MFQLGQGQHLAGGGAKVGLVLVWLRHVVAFRHGANVKGHFRGREETVVEPRQRRLVRAVFEAVDDFVALVLHGEVHGFHARLGHDVLRRPMEEQFTNDLYPTGLCGIMQTGPPV